MFDMLKKSMYTGIGLILKTRDEVEEFAKDWSKKQQLSEEEGRKFLDDILQKYDSSVEKLEHRVEDMVKKILNKTKIATQDEVSKLKKDLDELKEKLKKTKEDSK